MPRKTAFGVCWWEPKPPSRPQDSEGLLGVPRKTAFGVCWWKPKTLSRPQDSGGLLGLPRKTALVRPGPEPPNTNVWRSLQGPHILKTLFWSPPGWVGWGQFPSRTSEMKALKFNKSLTPLSLHHELHFSLAHPSNLAGGFGYYDSR